MGESGEDLRKAFEKAARTGAEESAANLEETVQILTFRLADEWYGFRLRDLIEITGGAAPTPIPFTPDYIPGVINHRGTVVSVVDLKRVFDLPARPRTSEGRIVIVSAGGTEVGFQADRISDLVSVPTAALEPPLSTIERVKASYIEGCIRHELGLLVLLDSRALVEELRPRREA